MIDIVFGRGQLYLGAIAPRGNCSRGGGGGGGVGLVGEGGGGWLGGGRGGGGGGGLVGELYLGAIELTKLGNFMSPNVVYTCTCR